MTATHIDGCRVVADRPATSALPRKDTGGAIHFRQIRELELDDGRIYYGCIHCDYTSPNMLSVRPHLNRHRKSAARKATRATANRARRKLAATPAAPRYDNSGLIPGIALAPPTPPAVTPGTSERWPDLTKVLHDITAARRNDVDIAEITADRDRWRARAMEAERLLDSLSAAMTGFHSATPKGA